MTGDGVSHLLFAWYKKTANYSLLRYKKSITFANLCYV